MSGRPSAAQLELPGVGRVWSLGHPAAAFGVRARSHAGQRTHRGPGDSEHAHQTRFCRPPPAAGRRLSVESIDSMASRATATAAAAAAAAAGAASRAPPPPALPVLPIIARETLVDFV